MMEQTESILLEAPPAESGEVYLLPTSFAQRRLWFLHQLGSGTSAYNVSGRFRFLGPLNVEALEHSLQEVVRRHEILRTTFLVQDDDLVQVVATAGHVSLPCLDLSVLPAAVREREMQEVLESVALRSFDLERGPLLRCIVIRLAGEEHAFLYVMHHILTDGWSEAIFVRELAVLYRDLATGRPPELPELPIQYGDFAQWQRDWLQGEMLERLIAYWRGRLAGASGVLDLPTDRPRPAVFSYRGATVAFEVPADVAADLRRLQERESATLFSLMAAAFGALLYRSTGQPDLLIGSPVANRNLPELEELIGLFLNMLVLRLDLSDNPTVGELLARAKEEVFGALEHQDMPYERLLLDLRLDRDPGRNPLFQVALAVQNTPEIAASAASLHIEPLPALGTSAKFDLQLLVHERGESILCVFEYATDLFDEATVRRLGDGFLLLLAGMARQPEARVRDLEMLTGVQRRELLAFAGTAVAGPPFCLHEAFARQAARTPDAVALSCGEESLTYGELNRRSDQLACYLQSLGIGPEVPVGLCLDRSVDMVVAILGVLKSGGPYLPMEPTYPAERIAFMIEDAAAPVVLTRSGDDAALPQGGRVRILRLDAEAAEIARATGRPEATATPANTAYFIYTSGSTGRPKGVAIPHANVGRLLEACQPFFGFGPEDVWSLFHSYAFDVSVWEIWGAFLYGGRLAVVPYLESRSPELFAGLLAREGVTILSQTPSAFRNLLSVVAADGARRLDRLRRIVFAGEALELQSLVPWWRLYAESHPLLVNMYGITETTIHSTYRALGPADLGTGSVVGRPLSHLEIHLLDAALSPVPVRVPGEIFVGGEGLARGYLGRPALTAERFIPDPFSGRPGARLYRSGDLARWRSGGDLDYLGRIDFQVKIRGYRIELGEIEAVLRRHPGVRDAVVVVREDQPGERRLVAYLLAAAGEPALGYEELRAWLKQDLPDPMIPAAFLTLESLPLTANGKIDKRALPAPGSARPDLEREYIPPRTPAEEAVATAWAEALGLDRVGAHDSFFLLGGDSIRALKAVALVRERGFEASVQQMFLHPTVADLASALQLSAGAAGRTLRTAPFGLVRPADRARLPEGLEDAYPLSGLQGGMLFHMQETDGSPIFHNLNSYHLRLPFDRASFERALAVVAARHPVLRTSFELTKYSEPLQLVHREARLPLAFEDLRSMTEDEQQQRIEASWREQLAAPFDLAGYPQIRFHAHLRDDEQLQLTVTENHAILDGWSMHTLYREILTCYFAFLRGAPQPELPPLTTTFRDFVALERTALETEETRQFWRSWLHESTALRVPRWRPRVQRPREESRRRIALELPADLLDALRHLARVEEVTLKTVFLAAHCKVMSLLGGTADVLTGMSSNGRPETVDGQNVCGLFLNTLPLRVALKSGTWNDLVRVVHEAQLAVMPHRRYPLSALQAQWGREALLETSFVYLNFHVMDEVARSGAVGISGAGEFIEDTNFVIMTAFTHAMGAQDGLVLSVACDLNVLEEEQARQIAGYYQAVLHALAAEPAAPHDARPLLSAAELQVLTAEWSGGGAAALPAEETLHKLFAAQVERTPDAACVVCEKRTLSFREVAAGARRLADRLRPLGVGPETRVALWLPRSEDLVVALLGVLEAGGAYLPIDPAFPAERMAFLLRDAKAAAVVTLAAWRDRLPAGAPPLVAIDGTDEAADGESRAGGGARGENLAYVIYTSGSTGTAKGVGVEHRQLLAYVHAVRERLELPDGASYAHVSTFAADLGNTSLFPPLCFGGTLRIVSDAELQDPNALAEALAQHPVDCLKIVPSQLAALLEHPQGAAFLPRQRLILGGEPLSWKLVETVRRLAPACRIFNHYGPTETTVGVVAGEVLAAPGAEASGPPLGRPLAHVRALVLGSDLQPVPAGTPGELLLGGAAVSRGYTGRPELTAERFIPDPLAETPGARVYRSGDEVRWSAGGELEFLGRKDHQVKIRGFRIELGEIEATLRSHPHVREAVVLARQDTGDGEKRLVAYVAADGGVSGETLRLALAEKLPPYMMPAFFVLLDQMPLTTNGKIDRQALPAPDAPREAAAAIPYVAPRDSVEEALAAIWGAVLGVDRVGIHESFFVLGGDSIRSIQVVVLARERGLRLSLQQLALHPTIAELATVVRTQVTGIEPEWRAEPFGLLTADDRARLPPGVEDAYPLSGLQGGILYHIEELPGTPVFHSINSFHLKLRLDPARLQQAVTRVASRHANLRTAFDLTGFSEPLQLVYREPFFPLGWTDLRALSSEEQETVLEEFRQMELRRPFDLTQPPQLRLHVHWRSDETLQLTSTQNHAIMDGWSLHTIFNELFAIYSALLRDDPPPALPPLRTSFHDYIALERQALQSAEQREYWDRKLEGCALPRMPQRRERVERAPGERCLHLVQQLPPEITQGLRDLARSEALPVKSVLLAAHCRVMGLLGGTSDVLTGLSSHGRPETPDGQSVCGLFLNTLPLRVGLKGGTWRDLVHAVHAAQLEMLPYRRYPLSAIQSSRGRERLIETSFVYLNFHVMEEAVSSRDLEAAGAAEFIEETNFVIMTAFTHPLGSQDALVLSVTCDLDVLEEEQARQIAGYYQAVLHALATEPAAPHDARPLLSAAELQVLTAEWSGGGAAALPAEETLHELFAAQAERTPDAACVVCEKRTLSFREVAAGARRLADRLRSLGVGPETRVALWLPRSEDLVVALLGVLEAGGAYLPIDPAFPAERIAFLLRDAGAAAVVTLAAWRHRLPTGAPPLVAIDGTDEATDGERSAGGGARGENLAYLIYTSGSTGTAKGVGVEHRQLLAYVHAVRERLELPDGASHAHVSTFAADLGNTSLFPPLCFGGTLRIVSDAELQDPNALAEALAQHPVDCLKIVPSQLAALLEHPQGAAFLPRQRLILGGEPLSWKLVETVRRLAPACRIFNHYGPTETTVGVVAGEVLAAPGAEASGPPLGRPLAHVRALVLGSDLQPVPTGTPGELLLGGAAVSRGYTGRPELTAERFIPDPLAETPGARVYRSGDEVRWSAGGELEFLGRKDHQVKIRGFRIELGEIEATLRSHPHVREAVVLARQDAGDGDKRLVAYVAADGVSGESLRLALAEKLPPYMVPAFFVLLDQMPLTTNGKIDRQALPAPESVESRRPSLGPADEIELQLVHIWERVLDAEQVGVTDNFFQLGGSSLQALRLVAQIRRHFGQHLLLSDLIDHGTIRALARLLSKNRSAAPGHLVPIQPRGENPPLYFIHPGHGNVLCYLQLARYLGPEQPFYGIQSLELDHDGDPYLSVEEMAARYVRLLRDHRPQADYLLGGWSFGGLIAFEMARQLRQAGESVPRVFLLDTRVPAIREELSQLDPDLLQASLLIEEARGVALGAGREPLPLTPRDLVALDLEEQLDLLLRELVRNEILPPEMDREMVRRYFHVRRARTRAMHAYVPQPCDSRVVLFRAGALNPETPLAEVQEIHRNALLRQPSYGWSELALEVEVEPVPGHHESMIRDPDVRSLAAALRRHIASVGREMAARERV